VVHVNTWLHPRFIPPHLPAVVTLHHVVHDPAFAPYKSELQNLYHRLWIYSIERKVLSRADGVTAVSAYTARKAIKHFGANEIKVIHNGVDTSLFVPPFERKIHTPFRLLFVGTWSKRKGVDLLPSLMKALGDKFELRYTGDAFKAGYGKGLPANCVPIGRPDTKGLVSAMQEADALLFPSRLEGFGLVAAEAMSCGLPVIATYGSSLPEVVEHGMTGWLCPQDDAGAFADAARWLADNPDQYRAMAAAAREAAVQRFSLDAMIDAYSVTFREVLLGSP
jgi:glycosyltransferase involved in cell wall biosynthesis